METTITPLLMFEGKCEEALTFYVSLFADGAITQIQRYGPEGPGAEGSVMRAALTLAGREFQAVDSPVHHAFAFTPSVSLFVDCRDEDELDRLYAALVEGGQALMEVSSAYRFSRKFGWINDRFGVSWQINLPVT